MLETDKNVKYRKDKRYGKTLRKYFSNFI